MLLITFKSISILLIVLVLIPYLLGLFIMRLAKNSNWRLSMSLSIILGVFCIFILYYIPAVIMIIYKSSLSLLTSIWLWEVIILSLVSVIVNRKMIIEVIMYKRDKIKKYRKENWLTKVLLISFFLLVLLQASLLSYSSIYDTDDARYIAESLDAIETDRMLLTNPLTGEKISEPIGEMIKDVICPFSMFQASISKVSEIHPAVLCHVILPLFLVPLCYMVYWLLGAQIFDGDEEKKLIFLNFVCILMMFGRMSAFWNSAYLLWRIWQGKAILAAIVIPFLFWLMQGIYKNIDCVDYYIFLFITTLGACILTPMSAIFSFLIIGIYTVFMFVQYKKPIILLRMGICCSPAIMLLLLTKAIGMVRYGL